MGPRTVARAERLERRPSLTSRRAKELQMPKAHRSLPDHVSSISARLRRLGYPRNATYADYLASEHWRKVRARYFASRATSKRCGCGKRGTALHHKTYIRLGAERLSDLELVCDACHAERHDIRVPRKSHPSSKAKVKHRRVTPDPRPRAEWTYDRDIRGQFVSAPAKRGRQV